MGLPEATAVGISDTPLAPGGADAAESLAAAACALRRHGGAGIDIERCLSLVPAASFDDLAMFAEAAVELKFRVPLRSMMPTVCARLTDPAARPGPEGLPAVVRLLTCTGRGQMFYGELFEFCKEHLDHLTPSDMATYIYEAGRHSLRARHFLEAGMRRAVKLQPEMSLDDVMKGVQGLTRFSRDWKEFFVTALPRLQGQAAQLTVHQLIQGLRVARDLRHLRDFPQLHAALATELTGRVDEMSLAETAACMHQSKYTPKCKNEAHSLVRAVEQRWSREEDLSPLRAVEVVDSLAVLASWNMKQFPLVDRLGVILTERAVEIKYTGNVSLWLVALQAFARMEHFDATWGPVALGFARDKAFVERISFFQQCELATSLAHIRLFDEEVYRNIAELLVSDATLFEEIEHVSPVLQAFVTAGYFHKGLFDVAYDMALGKLENETLDLSRRGEQVAFIHLSWCLAAAGYHKRYESFAAFLDYAFFADLQDDRAIHVRRAAELADLALSEAPEMAEFCQYPERLAAARSDARARRVVGGRPPNNPELMQDLRQTLQELGWPYEIFTSPDANSACYADVSLLPKLKEKVGLLAAGRRELLRDGLPEEDRPWSESGDIGVTRRLLASRGWRTALVEAETWRALPGPEEKRAYLEEAVRRAQA